MSHPYAPSRHHFRTDPSSHGAGLNGPTPSPASSSAHLHHTDDDPSLNNLHQGPLYPTVDGKPPKSQIKEGAFKKPVKPTDTNKFRPIVNADHDAINESDEENDTDDGGHADDDDVDDEDNLHLQHPHQHQHQHQRPPPQSPHPHQPQPPTHHSNKFDFINYDDEDADAGGPPGQHPQHPQLPHQQQQQQPHLLPGHPNAAHAGGPGPGFFNPAASKTQYADFDQYGHNLNLASPPSGSGKPFNPYQQQPQPQRPLAGGAGPQLPIGVDKLPPELFNLPNVRIEQLLQHIQGGGAVGGVDGGVDSGVHLPPFGGANGIGGGFPFAEHAGGDGVRPPPPGSLAFCFLFCFMLFVIGSFQIIAIIHVYVLSKNS